MQYSGLIAKYNLEDWYTESFTSKEKEIIENLFPDTFFKSVFATPYTLATELLLFSSYYECKQKKDGSYYSKTLSYWGILDYSRMHLHFSEITSLYYNYKTIRINKGNEIREIDRLIYGIYRKLLKKAYFEQTQISNIFELFIFIQLFLYINEYIHIVSEKEEIELCNKQVQLSEFAKNQLKAENKKLPKNNAYDILYRHHSFKENWEQCLYIAKKAMSEGWQGQWEKKIEDCERAIEWKRQCDEQEKLAHAKENEAIQNHDIKTLFELAGDDKNIYKAIIQNFEIEEWTNDFKTMVRNSEELVDEYCKKIYPEIIAKHQSFFIHMALGTLNYPKSMTPWIELLYFCNESNSCNVLNIENPVDTLKSYKCFIGIIINSKEKIYDYLETAKLSFPENEIKINPKNYREILIEVTSKDIVFKEKLDNPYSHYYFEFAKYLNKVGYNIDLSEIVMNCILNDSQDFGQFDFVSISKEFQNSFDKLLNITDKSYFTQKIITCNTSFIKPVMFTKTEIKNYLMENADRLLNDSWHTLINNIESASLECFWDNLPKECDFEEFYLLNFEVLNKNFPNEYRIRSIFSETLENQGMLYASLKLRDGDKISSYLQSANKIFQNHEVMYERESSHIYISIEKNDFVIQPLTMELMDLMLVESADIIEEVKKRNTKAKYEDEYIDLKSCAEYIFCSILFYIINGLQPKYYNQLKHFIELIDEEDLIKSEIAIKKNKQRTFVLTQELYNEVDFQNDIKYLSYVSMLKNKFVANFRTICLKDWEYFFITLLEKEYDNISSYISSPFENYAEPYQKINLLYNFDTIKENFGSDIETSFIPRIDTCKEREEYPRYQWIVKFGINLEYIHFHDIQTVLDKIFTNHFVNLKHNKRIAIVEIHIDFSDFDLVDDKNKLEKSFLKHLEFIKLAYCTNLQCKKKEHLEYISDELLLETIAYNESRYLFTVNKEFCDKLEDFFYAIGREKFIEKYKYNKK